jgi:hypothetical protein
MALIRLYTWRSLAYQTVRLLGILVRLKVLVSETGPSPCLAASQSARLPAKELTLTRWLMGALRQSTSRSTSMIRVGPRTHVPPQFPPVSAAHPGFIPFPWTKKKARVCLRANYSYTNIRMQAISVLSQTSKASGNWFKKASNFHSSKQ